MSYFEQFESFDPLSGKVPSQPFRYLPQIARRARGLLSSRTAKEIVFAAKTIDWAIDQPNDPERIYGPAYENVFDTHCVEVDDSSFPIPMMRTPTEVHMLRGVHWPLKLDDDSEFPDARQYEYFAVLALWLIGETLICLRDETFSQALHEMTDDLERIVREEGIVSHTMSPWGEQATRISLAGECALKAMDAVCYAEHLRDFEQQLESVLGLAVAKAKAEAGEEQARKRSLNAQRMNIERHANARRAEKLAVARWVEIYKKQNLSRERAAKGIEEWLKEQHDLDFERRTVYGWISNYEKGQKLAIARWNESLARTGIGEAKAAMQMQEWLRQVHDLKFEWYTVYDWIHDFEEKKPAPDIE